MLDVDDYNSKVNVLFQDGYNNLIARHSTSKIISTEDHFSDDTALAIRDLWPLLSEQRNFYTTQARPWKFGRWDHWNVLTSSTLTRVAKGVRGKILGSTSLINFFLFRIFFSSFPLCIFYSNFKSPSLLLSSENDFSWTSQITPFRRDFLFLKIRISDYLRSFVTV